MFFRQNSADVDAIAKTLISKGGPDGFRVLHHIFPDSPRDMNDNFVALALWTLIKFENSGIQVSWLPSWLVAPSQPADVEGAIRQLRSEEHTSELQSLMRISYAVFCLKKKNTN